MSCDFGLLAKPEGRQCRAPVPGLSMYLRTVGGTPYRDPCSLWVLIWGLPTDIVVI